MHMQRGDGCFVYGMADDDDDGDGCTCQRFSLFTGAHGMQYGTHDATWCWCCRMPIWWCIFIAQCGLWLRFTVFTMSTAILIFMLIIVRLILSAAVSSWWVFVLVNFLHMIYAIPWHLIFVLLWAGVVFLCPDYSMQQSSRQKDERRQITGTYWKNAIIRMDLLLYIYERSSIRGIIITFLLGVFFPPHHNSTAIKCDKGSKIAKFYFAVNPADDRKMCLKTSSNCSGS